jgi:hypothetical protein
MRLRPHAAFGTVFFSAGSSPAKLSHLCEGSSICDALTTDTAANAAVANEPKLNSVSHRPPALIIFPIAKLTANVAIDHEQPRLEERARMLRGPQGQRRPADMIGNAVHVMRIATGEIEDTAPDDGKNKAAQALGRLGGKVRAEPMSTKRRKEIARKVAKARWE